MTHNHPQLALLGKPIMDLTRPEVAAITNMARTLDAGAWHLAPQDAVFPTVERPPWMTGDAPPSPLRLLWPLPQRARGYQGEEAQEACRLSHTELVLDAGTRQHFLACETFPEYARRIGQAYCLLGFLPPYAALARLLREAPREPPEALLGVDVLLVEAGARTLARAVEDAHVLQHGLNSLRLRLGGGNPRACGQAATLEG